MYRCNGAVSAIENILFYNCYTDCTKASKAEHIVPFLKQKILVNYLAYQPKMGDKCDYKPSGLSTFFSAVIKKLEKHGKEQYAEVEYVVTTGDNRVVFVKYPNSSLLACGKGLNTRTDCPK